MLKSETRVPPLNGLATNLLLKSQITAKYIPMVEKSKLDEDLQGTPVDATLYHDMIGSLLYLTSTYTVVDHAGYQDTRRSTSGSAQFLGMKPKEPTYQVALDALALTTCYPAFLITAEVPVSGLDKIRLSRLQILWGMYYKKNLDFVALIWEDLAYQIDNLDSKKQDKMF
ncbi:hypothetical protein Tco_0317970 [Tanacetum coccineum]